jgi:hypothetical protein
MWKWCIDLSFLDLGTSLRWVVGFTPLPLYTQWKNPRYSLGRRLGLDHMGNRKLLTLQDFNSDSSVALPVASSYTDKVTAVLTVIHKSCESRSYPRCRLSSQTSFVWVIRHVVKYECGTWRPKHYMKLSCIHFCLLSIFAQSANQVGNEHDWVSTVTFLFIRMC